MVWTCIATGANAQTDDRSITKIAGDLYRFQNRTHYSVFLVTTEGVLVTDPINADAAKWLKAELAKRFAGVPIRYLVYSHSHADHIAGGKIFADSGMGPGTPPTKPDEHSTRPCSASPLSLPAGNEDVLRMSICQA